MPFKWIDREIFVRLDAVSRAYYVYANGHLAGYHADSKTPAYFDITPYVADGKNTLAVIAYAHPVSTTLENQIKTPGTCIEGDVSVIARPKSASATSWPTPVSQRTATDCSVSGRS